MTREKNSGNDPQLRKALKALRKARTKLEEAEAVKHEPIAIVGMGCRFPGGANDPESFWQMLDEGRTGIREVPAERWDVDAFYDPEPTAPGKINTRWGGFLDQPIEDFDAAFFGIAPREAAQMDAQQRLFLEVAWEALEDAGVVVEHLAGSRTGIFLGIASSDESWLEMTHPVTIDTYTGTGTHPSVTAGRLAYLYDLRGPAVSIDTACSSSLVAVHLACQSLRSRECHLAVVGGVYVVSSPLFTVALSKLGLLSDDGRCRTFDARAQGTVAGEGAGAVVLKRLSDAQRDGDDILALIRGTAINQDGRSAGLTAPNLPAQEAVIRDALANAKVDPAAVSYIETHGTGTPLGDPVEVEGLAAIYGAKEGAERPCVLGAVKSNIGHLMPSAGIAGLIKVVLALRHESIPAVVNFKSLNPHLSLDDTRLEIASRRRTWAAADGPRLAATSSFGWSGTNAHVLLEEAPAPEPAETMSAVADDRARMLPISARSPAALEAAMRSWRDFLSLGGRGSGLSLTDVAFSASHRRMHHEYRLAVVGHSLEEWVSHLDAALDGELVAGTARGTQPATHPSKLAFVFSGQGAQWIGMGRQLMAREPVFAAEIERCDARFAELAGWSLLEELAADEPESRLNDTEIAQPALFAMQIALVALWRSWGIEPLAVVGHSAGEIAASYVAGALSFEEATEVAHHRSRLMQRATGQGTMISVEMTSEEASKAIEKYGDRLSIAAVNSPTSVVLSGEKEALREVTRPYEEAGKNVRELRVNYAFHSSQMEPILDELSESLADLKPRVASLPIFSTVTGSQIDGRELDASYWSRGVRQTVRFAEAISALVRSGYQVFLKISPHPVLSANLAQCLRDEEIEETILPSLRRDRDELATMLASLAALYVRGYPVAWNVIEPAGRYVRLPSYPWQRHPCRRRLGITRGDWREPTAAHPLLGTQLRSADPEGHHYWDKEISAQLLPYLEDHRIEGSVVFPGTGYVEMALAAAGRSGLPKPYSVEQIELEAPLFLSGDAAAKMQVVLSSRDSGRASLSVYSQAGETSGDGSASWILHARGSVRHGAEKEIATARESLEEIRSRLDEEIAGEDYYRELASWGLEYGPAFQGIKRLWRGRGEALGELRVVPALEHQQSFYELHPALLDACFQVVGANAPVAEDGEPKPYMPIHIDEVRLLKRPGNEVWSHCRLRRATGGEAQDRSILQADVHLLDAAAEVIAEIRGLRLRRLEEKGAESHVRGAYEVSWESVPLPAAASGSEQSRAWLILADDQGLGEALAARLGARGDRCLVVKAGTSYASPAQDVFEIRPDSAADLRQLLAALPEKGADPLAGIVHAWSLDASVPGTDASAREAEEATARAQTRGCLSVMYLVQALAEAELRGSPSLCLVTRGAQDAGDGAELAVLQAPTVGLGRTLAHEHPELRCRRIDLDPAAGPEEVEPLLAELTAADSETEVAWRGGERRVPRLGRLVMTDAETLPAVAGRDPFRLEVAESETLEALKLRAIGRVAPGPKEVEIEIAAAGLNFSDVMKAMGLYPGLPEGPVPLGIECAGKISALGEEVEGFEIGDEVIAFGFFTFGSFVTTPAALVARKPEGLSFEEAATIPVTFATAYYALHRLGHLGDGERILIHSASGGVGQAAIQLAKHAGAEIFATAGNQQKRDFLRSLGIEHVMDSRSLDFAEQILEITGGEGVDLLLNSLAGEAIAKGLSILAPQGRFLEIGKRDIYQDSRVGLSPFQNNLSFFAIDLDRISRTRPEQIGSMLEELVPLFEDGTLEPLPHRSFPLGEAKEAFRTMAQAQHIGKIVLTVAGQEVLVAPASQAEAKIRGADGAYLITGGLGGLGLEVADWLVTQGARHLVLTGRSGLPREGTAAVAVARLEERGAEVLVARADVADSGDMTTLFDQIESTMPPLRGIVHAAGVLADGILVNQDRERFERVLAPKALGAWNLHAISRERNYELDFMVFFSSITSLIGTPGQGNYAAANAFMDLLAHHRRQLGLPALSVNWGPFARVGMAAGQEQLADQGGFESLEPEAGTAHLGSLLGRNLAQVAIAPLAGPHWPAAVASSSLLLNFTSSSEEEGEEHTLLDTLGTVGADERPGLVEDFLKENIARALQRPSAELDVHQPLVNLGLDSLMAVELKNQIGMSVQVNLPMSKLLLAPSIVALAGQILEHADMTSPVQPPATPEERGQWEEITI